MAAHQRQDRPTDWAPRNIEPSTAIREYLSCWMAAAEVAPRIKRESGKAI